MSKKIFIPYPSVRDVHEINLIKSGLPYKVIFDSCCRGLLEFRIGAAKDSAAIAQLIQKALIERFGLCNNQIVDGVVSPWDYPGSVIGSIIAKKNGLAGPDPELVLQLHHKYYSRQLQKKIVPDAVPDFALVGLDGNGVNTPSLPYPFFIKPVKAYCSMGAYIVHAHDQLCSILQSIELPPMFLEPFNYLLERYCSVSYNANYLIAESLLSGEQVTLEGFVFNGEVTIMGITDSIMYSGTISFARFEYPSRLSSAVQERMIAISKKLIKGVGLDNTMFNIEFMYDKQQNKISIIEVNPRMAHQFADLYEKVDGTNGYRILLDIAAGQEPQFKNGNGQYACAASCVMRTFEQARVVSMPDKRMLAKIKKQFPDVRIELSASSGQVLKKHDVQSYKYAIVNIGADSWPELFDRYEKCKRMLGITLAPISDS